MSTSTPLSVAPRFTVRGGQVTAFEERLDTASVLAARER